MLIQLFSPLFFSFFFSISLIAQSLTESANLDHVASPFATTSPAPATSESWQAIWQVHEMLYGIPCSAPDRCHVPTCRAQNMQRVVQCCRPGCFFVCLFVFSQASDTNMGQFRARNRSLCRCILTIQCQLSSLLIQPVMDAGWDNGDAIEKVDEEFHAQGE